MELVPFGARASAKYRRIPTCERSASPLQHESQAQIPPNNESWLESALRDCCSYVHCGYYQCI